MSGWLLCIGWLAFFFFQVSGGRLASERSLTLLALIMSIVLLIIAYSKALLLLFVVGVMLGLIIEVGLGLVARQQHWTNASLFGVPYWLPIIWGYGFVSIYRIGSVIEHMFT